MTSPFRNLPSVSRLLAHKRIRPLVSRMASDTVAELIRQQLQETRQAIAAGHECPPTETLVESVLARAELLLQSTLRPVINATGVIIHTNLGRVPLSREAIAAMEAVSHGYSNLEFDLTQGERGDRLVHLEPILCQITGAQAAVAVNNNAGAVLLALTVLTKEREVIISRGQAVEIGGGFRIPEVMQQSGARLVEVGTTNRTYLSDYQQAITDDTAALMRVHASNFRVIGFVESPPLEDLVRLAREHDLLLLDDLGSGCLVDTGQFGLAAEPTVQDSVAAGADLTLFSGDKLLGGPQAGIIVGREELVARLRRHPLTRALRLDKATVAALAATAIHYVRGEALEKIPVWRMIAMPLTTIQRRARRWARAIGAPARILHGRSMIGGGSLPEEGLPTRVVAISAHAGRSVTELAQRLRLSQPPVIGRIEHDQLLLDPRTVAPEDDSTLMEAIAAALKR
ncbi:MAG: L-seryl-tRNA(Sec) selenium transferase [Dehalococcoidia bacterium]|nr:MAG: L-seryl-tRNA(Sec) selenium transferase [Dehalococcoidia bacterium]